nr:ATP-binding cassette domain-containing protein [Marinicella sp. W31]MDC2875607.1 ATP-binding cassette domain-containing protein [Marinicella sp. W31]
MANLKLRNLNKTFGTVEIIPNVNLDIEDGEFVVFVGPSGCGKSTLLRMIAGLETATSGDILIDEKASCARRLPTVAFRWFSSPMRSIRI